MSALTPVAPTSFGLLAEFADEHQLVEAARKAREAGYRRLDAYSPFPVHGLDEALALPRNKVPLFVLLGGLIGALTGLSMETIANVFHYPLNFGGKSYFSWPNFIPVAYELTILFAGLTAMISMFLLNGLPRHHHPLFSVDRFDTASQSGFFLSIESGDPKFNRDETDRFLKSLGAVTVFEVPAK